MACACSHPSTGSDAGRNTVADGPYLDTATSAATPPGSCHYRGVAPDPRCTPGDVDPRVTQANISQTVCVSGYSSRVRPPVAVTEPIKRERMSAYGLAGVRLADEELDHLVPLELGGASTVANLWPQAWPDAHRKDQLEDALHRLVCSGGLEL